MYRDALDTERLSGTALLVDLDGLHLSQRGDPVVANHLPKHGVEPIQVRRLVKGDEELGAVGAGPFVRHRHHPTRAVAQGGPDLVLEVAAPDGLAALGVLGRRARWAACLDHELGDEAVEGGLVVVSGGAESEEVLNRWLARRAPVDGANLGPVPLLYSPLRSWGRSHRTPRF